VAVAGANVDLVSAQAQLQAAIGHKVTSARLSTGSSTGGDEHRHLPELGESFYERGVRMRRCSCRVCGVDLEPRRA